MKIFWVRLIALAMGCAFVQQFPAAEAAGLHESVVYSFCAKTNCPDGNQPGGDLFYANGMLYGTSEQGGLQSPYCMRGCGTVFSVDPGTGDEKVVRRFCPQVKCSGGAAPVAGVIGVNGVLYGMTVSGGNVEDDGGDGCALAGCGTVYMLYPKLGTETPLYRFCSQTKCTDGANALSSLIYANGRLYGTTQRGGYDTGDQIGWGTVFSLDPRTGAEKVLYAFCQTKPLCADGSYPVSGLINVGSLLYGTSYAGGSGNSGTVYSIDPFTGAHNLIYSFCTTTNCTDSRYPRAGLIYVNGLLYGTALWGGNNAACAQAVGCGTVFSIDPGTGAESIVYAFAGGTDGQFPSSGLTAVNGTLYGTTESGGGTGCYDAEGCGTVFSINLDTGVESVVYAFTGGSDGSEPSGGLIAVNGNLYGTTAGGGAYRKGAVFVLKPEG
jgi:uncharacterized repeat protein (TIGR03803 family)